MTKYMANHEFHALNAHFADAFWFVDEGFWNSPAASVFHKHLSTHQFLLVPAGEAAKTWLWLQYCLEWLCQKNWPVSKSVVGLGGGALLDLVALVAHLYKRGVPFISIPTTTLAMVDASLGGKCGINACGMKNMIGAMHEPLEHFLIPELLGDDLRASWIQEGMSEAYKHGLLQDLTLSKKVAHFFREPSQDELRVIIETAAKIKHEIMRQEKKQPGIRHLLNLGHTTAHGFEAAALEAGTVLSHGSAVAIGLVLESYLMSGKKVAFEIAHDLNALLPDLKELDRLWQKALAYMKHDKKGNGSTIAVTCFGKPGQMTLELSTQVELGLEEKEKTGYGYRQENAPNECWIKNIDVDKLRDCWKSFYHDFS
jgi:3-dehydroquinate synthase